MHGSFAGSIASSDVDRERLAKDWLVALVDRTPLAELGELPLPRLAEVATGLVAAISGALADPEAAGELTDPARAAKLAGLRAESGEPGRIYEDLGDLQALCVRTLDRELGERDPEGLAAAAQRLSRAFGALNAAVAAQLAGGGEAAAEVDPNTGFAGSADLHRWLAVLLAEQRRYDHGFALALVDVEGLGQINEAYGREAGDRMLRAVASILREELRDVDQAFRLPDDELAIVAPHTDAEGLSRMAGRVARSIAGAQRDDGPRIAVTVGVVECPADGLNVGRLLESAAEATYAAKAAGAPVARGAGGSPEVLQDP